MTKRERLIVALCDWYYQGIKGMTDGELIQEGIEVGYLDGELDEDEAADEAPSILGDLEKAGLADKVKVVGY